MSFDQSQLPSNIIYSGSDIWPPGEKHQLPNSSSGPFGPVNVRFYIIRAFTHVFQSAKGTNISNIVLRFMQEEDSEVSITMNEVVDDDDVVAREEKEEEEEDENVVIVAVCLF
ncbi:unnamed protein product [Lactuca saligna]|uniref:Uncharacterized protein n=1 Tax=Lactuca saligna TaxID=75948 RepID=A0AA36EDY3_LACSI|nr:unnamed protein product [Lactuca saligna]